MIKYRFHEYILLINKKYIYNKGKTTYINIHMYKIYI